MIRKSLIATGTVLLALGGVAILLVFLSQPTATTYAAPPSGCKTVNQDITTPTTWSEGCYEIVTNTVTVIPGITLTIAPTGTSTAIYFQTGARLQVEGNLQALGTPSRPITFTASNPTATSPCGGQGRWLGILFGTNSIRNRVQYAHIEYACTGIAPSGSTQPGDGDWILSNTMRYNGGIGEFNGSIGGDIDYSEIRNNTIYSSTNGIVLNEGSHNLMSNNIIRDIANVGLHLKSGGTGGGNYNTISRNEIYDCAGTGILVADGHFNAITNNAIHHCGAAGIYLDIGSSNQVLSNTIHSTMLTSSHSGAAIYVQAQNGTGVQYNHLYNNGGGSGYQAAIYVVNTPNLGVVNVANNVIHDSLADAVEYASVNSTVIPPIVTSNALCALTGGTYELRNNTTLQADARYNWWGTNTPPAGAIFGQANYTPWITLSIPSSDAYGVVTLTLRGQDGASFFTVPRTPTDLLADSPIPNARRVALTANWGHFEPAAVLINDQGIATAQYVPSGVGPLPARIIVTATDFCDFAVPYDLPLPDLAITKTALTTQAVVGGLVTYRIDYANQGNAAAARLTIRDTLPVGMQWVADTAVPPWTRGATTPEVVWTLPGLAAGARGSFLVTTTVNSAAACGLQLTNLAVITSTTLEARLDNNASSAAPVTVLCPSIEITKTGPTLSKVTDVVTYTYQIRNTSIPASTPPLDVVSIVDTGVGWPGLGNLTARGCTPLATGALCTFQVPYVVAAGVPDPLVNVVTATYRLTAFNQAVTATDSHSVNLFQPSITFSKTGDALSKIGDVTPYTLTLANTSSTDSPELVCRITDALLGLDQTVVLAAGAAPSVLTRPYTVPAGASDPLVNTANVICSPVGFPNVITATATHSVNLFQPSIAFAKTGDPLSKIGDSTTYTLTLDNTSSNDAPDLQCRITDAMLGLDQAVTLPWNAPLYVLTRQFTVPASAPDPLVNTANVTCSPIGFSNVITASDNHSVNLFQPAIQVDKSGPAEAHPGDTITYTFRITNAGSADSPALVLDAVTDVGVGWPGLGDLTARAAANGCTSLAAGAACVFGVPYAIPPSTPNGDRVNTVSVRYHPLGFTNSITDTDMHTLAIIGAVDIVVIKDDNVGPITNTLLAPAKQIAFDAWRQTAGSALATAEPYHREFVFDGDLVTYTISVVNVGVMPATNVVLTETLPLYTSYVGYGWTGMGGRTYITSVGTLQPGEGVVRYFIVRVNEPLPANINNLDNLVCGWAAEGDRAPNDNCNHEDTPVLRRPQIEKTFTAAMGVAGQVISFTITYTNPNNVPLTGVRITDTLPPDTIWHSDTATAAGWTRVTTTPNVAWYIPTLGAGVSGSFVLNVIYRPAVEVCDIALTNIVTLTVLNNNVAYFADADSERFTIRCPSDLVVIKDDDVGPTTPFAVAKQQTIERLLLREVTTLGITQHREFVYEGDVVTYTIAVENVGPYTATNVVLTEILPLYTDYIGYGWRLVSGRTYTMALGTLAPGQGGIYYFVVRAHDTIPEGVNNLINYVCGWSREPDYHPADNCNYEDTPLRRRPLRISKAAPRCIAPGDYFNYSTFYTNTNTTTGFVNVPITDTLSPFITYAGTNWACVGPICRYTIPAIPAATYNQPGPLLQVRLNPNFAYTADSRIVNTIEISGGYRYTLTSTVDLGPDLVVVKNDNIGPLPLAQQAAWDEVTAQLERPATTQSVTQRLYAQPGELITYTIVYVNSGVGTAHNVMLTERLPDYTTYVGGGWTHSVGPYYTMTLGTLAPGQGRDLIFVVEVVDPFPLGVDRVVNEVRITTTDEECDTSNNSSNDDTPIRTATLLYVANRTSNTIDVFQTTNFAYLTSIPTGDAPFGMVVVDNQLYVANATSVPPSTPSRVQVFDLATHNVITSVATGFGTLYLAQLDGYIYATDHSVGGEGITVIEHATHNVVARLKPDMPVVYDWGFFGITADPTRHVVYSTKRYMGAQGIWRVASTPTPLTFNLTYMLNTGDNLPYSTIYNRATDHVYVTFPHLHELRVYDPDDFSRWTVFPTQQQAPSPDSTDGGKGMAVMGECVYNANFAAQSVSVLAEGPCNESGYSVAAQSAIQTQETFLPPGTFLLGFNIYLPTVMRAWQAYPNVTHIPVGGSPKGLAAGGGIVFVTLPEQNRVAVIDTRQGRVVYWIPTQGTYPHTAVIVYNAPWLKP
ncbi:MAG TPA: right-handed parallel beta-helix repeat-containing protein [Anaerolineae bacterium]|nr:right-handed parallel beta-helix repeat-containing protein [Anaerolineae bacterium]HQI83126.1 right-handed parallel beta-helix repeat-containing protein [Anaerolineae bacterium]